MGQKMINVKPIKNKETLIQFGKELKKGQTRKKRFFDYGNWNKDRVTDFRYIEPRCLSI